MPPLRLISAGALNVDLENLILANVRTPDERKGDLGAQLAATMRATDRLKALAQRYESEKAYQLYGGSYELFGTANARDADGSTRWRRFF